MCGLTGILCFEQNNDIATQVAKMTLSLKHRGPDSEGQWVKDNIGLGHRRLSIIDLSESGAQPMISNCGRYTLAYNGEIYNHKDIRLTLEKEGVLPRWRGHSDTETLLAAIVHWGIDETLRHCKGMFALAIWDQLEKCLSLARDRIGEKPLYWGWAGKDFIFGSEIKALRTHPNFPKQICNISLSQYLQFMYIPAPRSIHPYIFKLEPGTILTIKGSISTVPTSNPIRPGEVHGNLSIRKYWNLSSEMQKGSDDLIKDDHEAVSLLDKTLSESIDRQMLSDVPLGAFLSGGIDSSTIVALMQSKQNRKVKTFTVGFEDSNYDESKSANEIANYLGTDHFNFNVTEKDAQNVIPNLPWLYDEPFADSSQIPTYLLSHAARQKVTVALSGDGGDELFGGYNRYIYGKRLWEIFSKTPLSIRHLLGTIIKKISIDNWNKFELIYNRLRSGSAGISDLGNKAYKLGESLNTVKNFNDFHMSILSNWNIPKNLLMDNILEPVTQFEYTIPEVYSNNIIMKMIIQDMIGYLPDDILCKVDRASMGVGLETRLPFLDPNVISFSARMPLEMKIRGGNGKWALRQVLNKYIPFEMIDRPKKGFSIPIGSWIRGPLKNWAQDLLLSKSNIENGIFNPAIIQEILDEHLSGRRDRTNQLWSVLMFSAWENENL